MSKRGKVAFVGTGGTISMTYSDRQGGLIPTESAGSILEAVPENYKENLEIIDWGHQPSSHYTIRMTVDLVQLLYKLVQDGISGIVIACGTDTLEEMAYLTIFYGHILNQLSSQVLCFPSVLPALKPHQT